MSGMIREVLHYVLAFASYAAIFGLFVFFAYKNALRMPWLRILRRFSPAELALIVSGAAVTMVTLRMILRT
jgi:hypothetical protein